MHVFITGASSGIGAALARAYAARGATLALVARREVTLNELADSLPTKTFIYPLDVTNAEALLSAANDFIAQAGLPDIVIANAGVSAGTLTEAAGDLKAFERIFATNVMGMVNTFAPFAGSFIPLFYLIASHLSYLHMRGYFIIYFMFLGEIFG